MSPADVDRLYTAVEQLRHEVHGYRSDLNGRLRTLETAEAERKGANDTKTNITRLMFGAAGMAAAISAVIAFILDRL